MDAVTTGSSGSASVFAGVPVTKGTGEMLGRLHFRRRSGGRRSGIDNGSGRRSGIDNGRGRRFHGL